MSAAALPYPTGPPAYPPQSGPSSSGERAFEHIDDLKAKVTDYNRNSSIPILLQHAERAINQADTLLEYRRPDLAFIEFVRASEIAVDVIPHHKDYTHFRSDLQGDGPRRLGVLQKRVREGSEQFGKIKEIIVNNNKRSGVRPQQSGINGGHVRTESAPVNGNGVHPKIKPTPSPKPEGMHGRAISTATKPSPTLPLSDRLSERFNHLRMNTSIRPDSRASNASSIHSSPISMPSAQDYNGRNSFEPLSRTPSVPYKPQGPRGMPILNGTAAERMPAPIVIPNLPQAPQAAYSPARNMDTSAGGMAAPRRTSTIVPMEPEISPEKLYDYHQRYHILLIDFRSREEFDQGHIYTRNILCVDPLSIRQGMSAEQLADALVLSPEAEQEMWAQRDQYDFVVYYDESTASMRERETKPGLTCLHEALTEFNLEKPLKRPPVLLRGGLEAWVDMTGRQALATSSTAGRTKAANGGIRRRPMASAPTNGANENGELRIPRRRLREYNPLDAEEEQFWREKARQESVVLPDPPELSADGVQDDLAEEDEEGRAMPTPDPNTAIREFLDRFPDAGNLDRQAFAAQKPTRPPPEAPRIPVYPPAPAASTYGTPQAQPPTRPAPIAPGTSYRGVSDRTPSASQPAPARGAGVPYIPPRLLANNIRLPRTGLVNFRNTCYMNSIIQALSATTPLSIFLLDDGYKSLLQTENWKGSKDIGFVTVHYSNLLRNLWKNDVAAVKPTTFRQVMRRKWADFDNDEQQDAKEFLDVLVEYMHQDMNTNWARSLLRALTPQEEERRESLPPTYVAKTEWGRLTHRELSFVYTLFAGQYASKLTCETCGFTSTTHDLMTSISVEIPARGGTGERGLLTLDDCLRSYCAEERLTRDERWECTRCGCAREARKRITLTRAPQFLVVHFKRFRSAPGRPSTKITTPVDFPLEDLDLEPYMLPPASAAEAQEILTRFGPESAKVELGMQPPYRYDCYAVVRHIGATMQSGHYVTAARDRGRRCWRWYNDTRVSEFRAEDVRGSEGLQSGEAYILFYQRRDGAGLGGGVKM